MASCGVIIFGVFWGKIWPEKIRENQTCTRLWLPFRGAFAPLFLKGILPFSDTGKRPVSAENPTISTEYPV